MREFSFCFLIARKNQCFSIGMGKNINVVMRQQRILLRVAIILCISNLKILMPIKCGVVLSKVNEIEAIEYKGIEV